MKEKNPYLRGLSVWVGFDQAYVDYVRQPRKEGSSKFNFFTKNPYLELIRAVTSFSSKPLYGTGYWDINYYNINSINNIFNNN